VKIIEADNLKKDYNGFSAVKGVNFHINRGEIFGFLGPNGAGKTTTINMLTGLARISGGRVKLLGEDYTHNHKKAQAMMGIVPDESNLYEELNGWENLCFCGALYGMERDRREKRAQELIEQFGLEDAAKKPFKAYSKGMKRKLTIAAGIIHEPEILFLDEPTTGIDVAFARQIRNLIVHLHHRGTTIFLTTHYIEEAERLCERLAFIVEGEIVREGTVEELMKEAQGEKTLSILPWAVILTRSKKNSKQFSRPSITGSAQTAWSVSIRLKFLACCPWSNFLKNGVSLFMRPKMPGRPWKKYLLK